MLFDTTTTITKLKIMNSHEVENTFEARPMLRAGTQASVSSSRARNVVLNCQSNAAGDFSKITSLIQAQELGWNAADNLVKNFPKQ